MLGPCHWERRLKRALADSPFRREGEREPTESEMDTPCSGSPSPGCPLGTLHMSRERSYVFSHGPCSLGCPQIANFSAVLTLRLHSDPGALNSQITYVLSVLITKIDYDPVA